MERLTRTGKWLLQGSGWPLLSLFALVIAVTIFGGMFESGVIQRAVVLGLIYVGLTVGLYTFSGNTGILSFGHLSFMAVGAYVSSWFTVPVIMKSGFYSFPGPLDFLETASLSPLFAILIGMGVAALFAALVGPALSRLSGMEASIATLALLLIINVIVSNWDAVTQGQRTVVGVPAVVGAPEALVYALIAIAVAFAYQMSPWGKRLRASREQEEAARVLGVNVARERWFAFVLSAAIVGAGGGMFGHFSNGFSPDEFFLDRTFLIVAMLIIGGMYSLSGAVVGAVVVAALVELLRQLEAGFSLVGFELKVPSGVGDIVLGLVLLLMLVMRPTGIVGSREWRSPFGGRRAQEDAGD